MMHTVLQQISSDRSRNDDVIVLDNICTTKRQRCFRIKGRDGVRATELSFLQEVKQTWLTLLTSPHMTTILKKKEWTKEAVGEREITAFQLSSNHPAVTQTGLEPCRHRSNPSDAALSFLTSPDFSILTHYRQWSQSKTHVLVKIAAFLKYQVCYGYMLSVWRLWACCLLLAALC